MNIKDFLYGFIHRIVCGPKRLHYQIYHKKLRLKKSRNNNNDKIKKIVAELCFLPMPQIYFVTHSRDPDPLAGLTAYSNCL